MQNLESYRKNWSLTHLLGSDRAVTLVILAEVGDLPCGDLDLISRVRASRHIAPVQKVVLAKSTKISD